MEQLPYEGVIEGRGRCLPEGCLFSGILNIGGRMVLLEGEQ